MAEKEDWRPTNARVHDRLLSEVKAVEGRGHDPAVLILSPWHLERLNLEEASDEHRGIEPEEHSFYGIPVTVRPTLDPEEFIILSWQEIEDGIDNPAQDLDFSEYEEMVHAPPDAEVGQELERLLTLAHNNRLVQRSLSNVVESSDERAIVERTIEAPGGTYVGQGEATKDEGDRFLELAEDRAGIAALRKLLADEGMLPK